MARGDARGRGGSSRGVGPGPAQPPPPAPAGRPPGREPGSCREAVGGPSSQSRRGARTFHQLQRRSRGWADQPVAQEALGRGLYGRTCSVSPPRDTPLIPPPTPASSLALLAVLGRATVLQALGQGGGGAHWNLWGRGVHLGGSLQDWYLGFHPPSLPNLTLVTSHRPRGNPAMRVQALGLQAPWKSRNKDSPEPQNQAPSRSGQAETRPTLIEETPPPMPMCRLGRRWE